VKLLRFLGERTFERVGSSQTLSSDVRIIAATNRNLEEEVAAGNFREDLFFRLRVVELNLPPLRDRGTDAVLLARAFLKEFADENAKAIVDFHPDAVRPYSTIIGPATCASCAPPSSMPWCCAGATSSRSAICRPACAGNPPPPRIRKPRKC